MARATKIYIAMGANGQTLAAFTVKHELVFWLKVGGRYAIDVLSVSDGAQANVLDDGTRRPWEPRYAACVSIAADPLIAPLLRNAPDETDDGSAQH